MELSDKPVSMDTAGKLLVSINMMKNVWADLRSLLLESGTPTCSTPNFWLGLARR